VAYIVAEVLVDQGRKEDARKVLERALQSKSLFVFRPDAEKLLAQLKS
jgi:hypothetical protein